MALVPAKLWTVMQSTKTMKCCNLFNRYRLLLITCSLLLFLYHPKRAHSIILCDEDCIGQQLDVCMKDDQNKIPLNLMGFFPCDGPDFRGRGLTVAAQMAVRAVLRDPNILPNHSLRLSFDNTMVCCSWV